MCDLEARRVLASLPDRDASSLQEWLVALGDPWAVEGVMIDMSLTYRDVVELCLPAAKIVADRFHVVRRVGRALDQVRPRLQRTEGFDRNGELCKLRYNLLVDPANWSRKEEREMGRIFNKWPELEVAWKLKEDFRAFYGSKGREQAEHALAL